MVITTRQKAKGFSTIPKYAKVERAQNKVSKMGRKYASVQREYTEAIRRFKKNGAHISRNLISRLETARANYEKARKQYHVLYLRVQGKK